MWSALWDITNLQDGSVRNSEPTLLGNKHNSLRKKKKKLFGKTNTFKAYGNCLKDIQQKKTFLFIYFLNLLNLGKNSKSPWHLSYVLLPVSLHTTPKLLAIFLTTSPPPIPTQLGRNSTPDRFGQKDRTFSSLSLQPWDMVFHWVTQDTSRSYLFQLHI